MTLMDLSGVSFAYAGGKTVLHDVDPVSYTHL